MRVRRHARPALRRFALLAVVALCAGAALTSSATALGIKTEVTLQDGEVGVPYTFEFDGEEGCQPYHFAFLAGQLPPGLTVTDDGELTGTPTQPGAFVFWVQLTDGVPGGACHTQTPSQGRFHVLIAPAVTITAALPGAKVGAPVNTVVTATGGGSLQWSVTEGALPPGLSLDVNTGALTGVPTTVGTYPFTVLVRDDKRRATRQYSYVVAPALAVAPSVSIPGAEVGVPVDATVKSTGGIGPVAWTQNGGALPDGLSLDPTGAVKGTPTGAGRFAVPVTATDVDGQAVQSTLVGRVARRLKTSAGRVAAAHVGKPYRLRFVTDGGVGPLRWSSPRALPRGLSLDRSTGVVTGTPRAAGTFKVTAKATDTLGITSSATVAVSVT